MRPRRSNSMQVLLSVRRLREQAEERLLLEAAQRTHAARARATHIREELARSSAARTGELTCVRTGAEWHQHEAVHRSLLERRIEADRSVAELDQIQRERMALYRAARCDRELISHLIKTRRAAEQIAFDRAEQKVIDGIYAARNGRKCDSATLATG